MMSGSDLHLPPKGKLVTNLLIGHDANSMSFAGDESCGNCQVRKIDVSDCNLEFPYNSNQLSETRGFLALNPKLVTSPYVSFSSTKMAVKTSGLLTSHSGCNFAAEMNESIVLAPYLIKQSLCNLVEPEPHAPPYAFYVPDIYKSIFEHSPDLQIAASLVCSEFQLKLPFCSSFVCSKEIYGKFYDFISNLVESLWDANQFQFSWFENWGSTFGGRETGLLLERASALWFGLNPEIEVVGNGFGNGYPTNLLSNSGGGSSFQNVEKTTETESFNSEVYN